jgi:hypothetical protein
VFAAFDRFADAVAASGKADAMVLDEGGRKENNADAELVAL